MVGGSGTQAEMRAVEMTPDGRAFVPGDYLQYLGNGDLEEGRRFVVRIIGFLRAGDRVDQNEVLLAL
jgi:hypothetical protein